MRTVAKVLGAVAALLVLFLLVGLLLPGRWSAEESVVVAAPPEEIFPWLNTLALWEEWTNPWPEGETRGPAEGVGAERSWDDPMFGAGTFTIVRSEPPRLVGYEVRVERSLRWEGRLELEPLTGEAVSRDGPGTRVVWSEEGDFGWNPLMGYMARMMRTSQGDELARGLARLRERVEGAPSAGTPSAAENADGAENAAGARRVPPGR